MMLTSYDLPNKKAATFYLPELLTAGKKDVISARRARLNLDRNRLLCDL
jgi:hypothetical protein